MADTSPNAGYPLIGPLYLKMTEPRTEGGVSLPGARDIFGELSFTSQFKVCLHLVNQGGDPQSNLESWLTASNITNDISRNAEFDFFCAEAMLPGGTFNVTEERGSRQGVTEAFPIQRVYQPFNITLYIDNDYKIIRLFEEWMNFINPLYEADAVAGPSPIGQGNFKGRNEYFRMKYPDTYKRIISVVKFERNFIEKPELSLDRAGNRLGSVPTITYRMIDAFPTNITAMPVSYEGSTILKTTVEFNYSRYVIEKNQGTIRPSRFPTIF
jgi:hypothetical protein